MAYHVETVSKEPLLFGESPLWDGRSKKLVLTDCFDKSIGMFDPTTKEIVKKRVYHAEEVKYIVVAVPYARQNSSKFVVASSTPQLVEFDWDKDEITNVLFDFKTDKTTDVDPALWSFNDGKCDAKGRLWIGTGRIQDLNTLKVEEGKGEIHRFSKSNGKLDRYGAGGGFDLPNGFGWNMQNDRIYYNDLMKRVIITYDFDLENGTLHNRKTFFDYKDHSKLDGSFPDGLVVDVCGNVWVACWKGSCVIKIDGQTGKLMEKITLPVTNTTSVCFGGEQHNYLYVTSTSIELDKSPVLGQPEAGKIFEITLPQDNTFKGFQHHFLEV